MLQASEFFPVRAEAVLVNRKGPIILIQGPQKLEGSEIPEGPRGSVLEIADPPFKIAGPSV